MNQLDIPRAILLGLTFVALAIVVTGFLGPRNRYQFDKLSSFDVGERFVRLDTFTGEGRKCVLRAGQAATLECAVARLTVPGMSPIPD